MYIKATVKGKWTQAEASGFLALGRQSYATGRPRRLSSQGRMFESQELHNDQTPETFRGSSYEFFHWFLRCTYMWEAYPSPAKGPPKRIRHHNSPGSSSVYYTFQAATGESIEIASGSEASYGTLLVEKNQLLHSHLTKLKKKLKMSKLFPSNLTLSQNELQEHLREFQASNKVKSQCLALSKKL